MLVRDVLAGCGGELEDRNGLFRGPPCVGDVGLGVVGSVSWGCGGR